MNKIIYVHEGDVGTIFRLKIQDTDDNIIDVSTATNIIICLRKPNGRVLERTASFSTDGTDGRIEYKTIPGDIDTAGSWSIQGFVETSLGRFSTKEGFFTTYSSLAVN